MCNPLRRKGLHFCVLTQVYQMSTKNRAGAAEGEGLAKTGRDLCLPKVNHRHFSAQFPPRFPPHFHPIFLPFPQLSGESHAPDAWFFRPKY